MEQRIVNVILRWMWLLVLATVASGLAVYWFGSQQPAEYEATARLIIGPGVDGLSPDLNDLRAGAQLMQTYSELATTRPVLQAVVDDVGLEEGPDRLRNRVTVRDNAETQILSIIVQDGDPIRSAAIANSIANVLLRLSPSGGESPAALLMNQIRTQAATIEGNIATIEERIVQLEDNLQAATTAQEQQLYIDQLAQERTRLAESRSTLALLLESLLNTPTNQVKIVEPAIIGYAISQSLPLLVLIGSAAGLLLSAVAVLGYEFLDKSIKSAGELEEIGGVTVMGSLILEDEEIYGHPDSLTVRSMPQSPTAEEYRRLATRLPLLGHANPLRSIVVSGLDDTTGASGSNEVAANLAVVLAQTGLKVLLVDANLTHPTAHTLFDLPTSRGGLSDLLRSRASRPQLNTIYGVPGLSVLASGDVSYDAFSDLASPMTRKLFDDLQDRVDVIVVAAPPFSVAASLFLASHADGVVLVAQRGESSYAEVEQALSNLNALELRFVGSVLTMRGRRAPAWLRNLRGTVGSGARRVANAIGRGLSRLRDGLSRVAPGIAEGVKRLRLGERIGAGTRRMRRGVGEASASLSERAQSIRRRRTMQSEVEQDASTPVASPESSEQHGDTVVESATDAEAKDSSPAAESQPAADPEHATQATESVHLAENGARGLDDGHLPDTAVSVVEAEQETDEDETTSEEDTVDVSEESAVSS